MWTAIQDCITHTSSASVFFSSSLPISWQSFPLFCNSFLLRASNSAHYKYKDVNQPILVKKSSLPIPVVSQQIVHLTSTLQACQRGGWALFHALQPSMLKSLHLACHHMKEHPSGKSSHPLSLAQFPVYSQSFFNKCPPAVSFVWLMDRVHLYSFEKHAIPVIIIFTTYAHIVSFFLLQGRHRAKLSWTRRILQGKIFTDCRDTTSLQQVSQTPQSAL